jgi:type II restriction enzyme
MLQKTAEEIYRDLIETEKIIGETGNVSFNLKDISFGLKSNDAVGSIMQDWMEEWLDSKGIEFEPNEHTQEFPDFYLNIRDKKKDLLEVKVYDIKSGPGFDIANFDAYCRSLKNDAYKLNTDYLIFGYSKNEEGTIKIEALWLKKIWEISRPSEEFAVNCQVKQDIIHALRPATWYSSRTKFKPFSSKQDFVNALYNTLIKYDKTVEDPESWIEEVKSNYKEHTGEDLL